MKVIPTSSCLSPGNERSIYFPNSLIQIMVKEESQSIKQPNDFKSEVSFQLHFKKAHFNKSSEETAYLTMLD